MKTTSFPPHPTDPNLAAPTERLGHRRPTRLLLVAALTVASMSVVQRLEARQPSVRLITNEIDATEPHSRVASEFIELKNVSGEPVDLSDYSVVVYESHDGADPRAVVTNLYELAPVTVAPGHYFVLCSTENPSSSCDARADGRGGPAFDELLPESATAAVAVVRNRGVRGTGARVEDLFCYRGPKGVGMSCNGQEERVPLAGVSRVPDGHDVDKNLAELRHVCATPGRRNLASNQRCPAGEPLGELLINEIAVADEDPSSFVEIVNDGLHDVTLSDYQLINRYMAPAGELREIRIPLADSVLLAGDRVLLCADVGFHFACIGELPGIHLPGVLALVHNRGLEHPNGALRLDHRLDILIDSLAYGTSPAAEGGPIHGGSWTEAEPVEDSADSLSPVTLSRICDRRDTGNNAADFRIAPPTPGEENRDALGSCETSRDCDRCKHGYCVATAGVADCACDAGWGGDSCEVCLDDGRAECVGREARVRVLRRTQSVWMNPSQTAIVIPDGRTYEGFHLWDWQEVELVEQLSGPPLPERFWVFTRGGSAPLRGCDDDGTHCQGPPPDAPSYQAPLCIPLGVLAAGGDVSLPTCPEGTLIVELPTETNSQGQKTVVPCVPVGPLLCNGQQPAPPSPFAVTEIWFPGEGFQVPDEQTYVIEARFAIEPWRSHDGGPILGFRLAETRHNMEIVELAGSAPQAKAGGTCFLRPERDTFSPPTFPDGRVALVFANVNARQSSVHPCPLTDPETPWCQLWKPLTLSFDRGSLGDLGDQRSLAEDLMQGFRPWRTLTGLTSVGNHVQAVESCEYDLEDDVNCVSMEDLVVPGKIALYGLTSKKVAFSSGEGGMLEAPWTTFDDHDQLVAHADMTFQIPDPRVRWKLRDGTIIGGGVPGSEREIAVPLSEAAKHEYGHFLGLLHNPGTFCFEGTTMFPQPQPGATSLQQHDVHRARVFYPSVLLQNPERPNAWWCSKLMEDCRSPDPRD